MLDFRICEWYCLYELLYYMHVGQDGCTVHTHGFLHVLIFPNFQAHGEALANGVQKRNANELVFPGGE